MNLTEACTGANTAIRSMELAVFSDSNRTSQAFAAGCEIARAGLAFSVTVGSSLVLDLTENQLIRAAYSAFSEKPLVMLTTQVCGFLGGAAVWLASEKATQVFEKFERINKYG